MPVHRQVGVFSVISKQTLTRGPSSGIQGLWCLHNDLGSGISFKSDQDAKCCNDEREHIEAV